MSGRRARRAVVPALMLACLAGCGPVESDGDEAADATPPGERVYRRFCYSCHEYGVAGAPRVGDLEAWKPRLAQGREVLLERTVEGYRGMPAMGLCRQCTEAELVAAIDHMIERTRGGGQGASAAR